MTSARRLGERRAESWAEHQLGKCAYEDGDYIAAAAAHTRAAAALEAVGPALPGTLDASPLYFTLPEVLHALGISLKFMDDIARAERAYLQSLAAHDTWGDCVAIKCDLLGLPRIASMRQQNCAHLVSLYRDAGAKLKLEARLRMWRALLDEESVECPGDNDGWMLFAEATAKTAAEALDIVARARRLYAPDGPPASHVSRAMRFTEAFRAAAVVLAKLGDTDAACELMMEAAADAGSAAVADAWRMQATALSQLASQLRPEYRDEPLFDDETNANRAACLRMYCRAAALYPAAARHSVTYRGLLETVSYAVQELYVYDGAETLLSDADVVFNLPNGGVARLSEPLGRGMISLSEAVLQGYDAHFGAQSPRVVERLTYHAQECTKQGDLIGGIGYYKRLVALCISAFGARHDVTQTAQHDLDTRTQHLSYVQSTMPAHLRSSRDAVHQKAAAMMSPGRANAFAFAAEPAVQAASAAVVSAADAAVKAATRGRRFACAACGALPAQDATPFQKCAACTAVTYCGKECQRAHWPAHRADCKKLRKPKE